MRTTLPLATKVLLVVSSLAGALLAWVLVVFPPGRSWHGDEPLRSWVKWFGIVIYTGVAWALLEPVWNRVGRNFAAIVLSAAVAPVGLVIVGLFLQPMHRAFDEAIEVWDGYRLPIPTGELSPPRVAENVDNFYETVCAFERRPGQRPSEVCLEINLSRPRGHEVEGGFRANLGRVDGPLPRPYDCFGEPVECEPE